MTGAGSNVILKIIQFLFSPTISFFICILFIFYCILFFSVLFHSPLLSSLLLSFYSLLFSSVPFCFLFFSSIFFFYSLLFSSPLFCSVLFCSILNDISDVFFTISTLRRRVLSSHRITSRLYVCFTSFSTSGK